MKRFLFSVAVLALSAAVSAADDKPVTGTTATPAAPVVVTSSGPVVESVPAQPTRRGLFGRLRNRNTPTTTYSTPVMTAPTTGATPMPPVATPTPMAMPGTKTSTAPMTGTVVQATGNLPPGRYTTTDGMIVQIGATQPVMDTTSTATQTSRRGLFGRLRR